MTRLRIVRQGFDSRQEHGVSRRYRKFMGTGGSFALDKAAWSGA